MIARTNVGGNAAFLTEPITAGNDARVHYAEQLSLRATDSGGSAVENATNAGLIPELSRKIMKNGTMRFTLEFRKSDTDYRPRFMVLRNGTPIISQMPSSSDSNWRSATADAEVSVGDIIEFKYASPTPYTYLSMRLGFWVEADFSGANITSVV